MTAAELDARVLRSIRRNPHSRAVEIAERIGAATIEVRAALYRLKFAKVVHTRGNTRATTYTAA